MQGCTNTGRLVARYLCTPAVCNLFLSFIIFLHFRTAWLMIGELWIEMEF
jgi:hypothetical protein